MSKEDIESTVGIIAMGLHLANKFLIHSDLLNCYVVPALFILVFLIPLVYHKEFSKFSVWLSGIILTAIVALIVLGCFGIIKWE